MLILRALWHVTSNFSILINFAIGYERLLIKYMLKEYSQLRFSRRLSNTSTFLLVDFVFLTRLCLPHYRFSVLLDCSPSSAPATYISLVGCLCK